MKKVKNYIYLILISVILLVCSCSTTKYIKENELLLKKENIQCKCGKIDKNEIYNILLQTPNKKLLGLLPIHLWIYNSYKPDKKSKFKEKAGEPPVIYSEVKSKKAMDLINKYLDNKGYFNSEVKLKKNVKNKKIKLVYEVFPHKPFTVGKIKTKSKIPAYDEILQEKDLKLNQLTGKNFDINKLNQTREEIASYFKNRGFYYFSKNNIVFLADSTSRKKEINLIIVAKKDEDNPIKDTTRYYVNNIYINQQYNVRGNYAGEKDTLNYKDKVFFIVPKGKKPNIRPKIIAHCLSIKKGHIYKLSDHQKTHERLNALDVFNYINMDFQTMTGANQDSINCLINMSIVKTKSFAIQTEGTNSGGYLGFSGNIAFNNLNTFRGGEKLSIQFNGGIEIQPLNTNKDQGKIIENLPFNTLEYGPQISLDFPRFLLPVKLEKFSKSGNPHTLIDLLYSYQFRPDYNRRLASLNFSYKWNETNSKQHIIKPIALSFIKINPSDEFVDLLQQIDDPFVYSSYQDHLIVASQYSFIINKKKQKKQNQYYFRFNFEGAGNLLSLFSNLSNQPLDKEGDYRFFNVRYAQYLRGDLDLRFYHPLRNSTLAYRFIAGLGVPYGNSSSLPYSRSFYAGGANDIRAWRVRTLGPGSLNDSLISSKIDQMGAMQLETSVEYRFDIIKFIKGAFFVDAGNIWLLNKDPKKPDAEININRFWQDIAIGTGFGIRLDFSYFLLRFDLGLRLKDPGSSHPKRIRPDFKSMPLNIGIGYPF